MLNQKYISIYIILLGVCFSLNAQENFLLKKLSLSYEQQSLEFILNDITQKTGVEFSFNPDKIPVDTNISFSCTNKAANHILDELLSEVKISWKLVGKHIVLKEAPSKVVEIKPIEIEKFTISGYIVDSTDKEVLIGATVYDKETGKGTLSNKYGFFSLTLPKGNYRIETSYLGYSSISKSFLLDKNIHWQIKLKPIVAKVEPITIVAVNREKLLFESLSGQINIEPIEVKKQSAALGETEMLKSLDMLPGINFQSDGSSYFHVRGGGKDQNLILLDEATIYNPSHLLGLFTPIIPEAVKHTEVYKADFPIEYGGRLSSVVDIRTRDGNKEEFQGSMGIGLVSTRFNIEGPIRNNSNSYFISFRRSHFGWAFKAYDPSIQDFFFNDFTTKWNIKLSNKDRFFITFYNGRDIFTGLNNNKIEGLEWGNTSLTLRWNHVIDQKTFVNTTLYASNYDYYFHIDKKINHHWNSHISNLTLKTEATHFYNAQNKLKLGFSLGGYFFNPGNISDTSASSNISVSQINSSEMYLYAGNEHQLGDNLRLIYGLRLTSWANLGESFVVNYNNNFEPLGYKEYAKGEEYYRNNQLEPRVSFSYKINTQTSLKASYNRTIQHINLINNSISPFNSLEVWLPSGPNIKPQTANIYSFSFHKSWFDKYLKSGFEAFYKDLHNQMAYDYHPQMLLNPFIEGELRQGNGEAYGFEIFINKQKGRLSGQLNYSYTRSFLHIAELNGGRRFPARQDMPVDLSLALFYQAKPRINLSLNALYSSGMRISTPTSFYYYRGSQVPIYAEQNNSRLPDYKRIDLAADFRLDKGSNNIEQHLTISLYNFFWAKNAAFLNFTKTEKAYGELIIPADKLNKQELTPTIRYIYGIVPSVFYSIKF